ncbi:MAG: coiled-coil domain-containing protein [bacterium]
MDIKESIRSGLQELILPELSKIKEENANIKMILDLTNKRLDDINQHLVDQSRRIDETNKRIDETNERIDNLRVELRTEIVKTNERIDNLRVELRTEIAKTNERIDRLYEVIVRRDEHNKLEARVLHLEEEIKDIKTKLAA